jgi:RsiW-degrading membrane proteinase PrsW (M82 family)
MNPVALLALISGLALAPALVYILIIWWLDRYEKEPVSLAVLAFVWGATPAIVLALIFEVVLDIPFAAVGTFGEFAQGSLIAPLVEEGTKGIILFVLFLAYRHEFDDVLDGILYGALVGLGFSVVENIVYGYRFAYPNGIESGQPPDGGSILSGWFLRSILLGLNH